jgi:DNA-binding PadR family transcriptional regulator
MSLPHALLTALAEQPGSGSDLASRFDRSIGYFWQATHQQIYRELARLEEAGWVKSLPQESTRGRKRAYRILPAGRKELKRWIAQVDEPKPLRDELMVRLRAEAAIGPAGLQDQVQGRLEAHRAQLDLYLKIEARDFAGGDPSREQQLQHLVLKAGIAQQMLWVQLAEEALRVLALPPSGDAAAPTEP